MSWIELVAQSRPPQAPPGVQPPQNSKDWFRIENSAEDAESTDVYVYDSIGGFWGMYADEFIQALGEVSTSKISLRLNSPGGSVFEGIAIANAIRTHPADVTVYVDSVAASIASVIAMAGDRLVMMPHSQIMVHNASGAAYGDASEMTKMADLLDKQSRNIAEAYAQHTGRPLAEWQQYMADETWFTAEEAVAVGLADEVMPMKPVKPAEDEPEPAEAKMHHAWDLSMYRYAGREQAPAPVTEKANAPVAGSVITAQMVAGLADTEFFSQFKALMREAVHDELAEVLDAISPKHSTSVESGAWDAGANEKRLPSPVPVATVKKMYTFYDADTVEDGKVPKSSCKLPHHFVSADGTPGAASVNGVRNALARLPQTQGLSDAERSAAEAHLRAHLNAYSGGEEDHAHLNDEEHGADHTYMIGDRVRVTGTPHEEEHTEGTVQEIGGTAYGILFDGTDEVHHWYTADELEATEDSGAEESPPPQETYTDQADTWDQVVGFLYAPTSPGADDVFAKIKEAW